MGKLFYVMGKSASGKDSLFSWLLERKDLKLQRLVTYTTRPMREDETDGREYHFVDEEVFRELLAKGSVIESRAYRTTHGLWRYFTADAGLDFARENYLGIGTLESYRKIKGYYGEEYLVPIYLEVADKIRIRRALDREDKEKTPRYQEVCRRFLADEEDFGEGKLAEAGIEKRFQNLDRKTCFGEIETYIRNMLY